MCHVLILEEMGGQVTWEVACYTSVALVTLKAWKARHLNYTGGKK